MCPPGVQGELVVTEPMPSMPVGFWGDPTARSCAHAYFADYPGVWRHGDWITFTDDGACVISGRSDATLNRGGVRLGTSDFYAVVEGLPEVADSLVVHLEGDDPDQPMGELLLFVALTPGADARRRPRARAIVRALRTELSPRHVPDAIHAVPAVPRTLSGKKLEVPVKRILGGAAADAVASRSSLADPDRARLVRAVRRIAPRPLHTELRGTELGPEVRHDWNAPEGATLPSSSGSGRPEFETMKKTILQSVRLTK